MLHTKIVEGKKTDPVTPAKDDDTHGKGCEAQREE